MTNVLPDQVNIFGIPYTIEKKPNVRDAIGNEMDGLISHHDAMIYISDGMHPLVEMRTVMHEVIHAMFKIQGHGDYRRDEDLIEAIENGVIEIMRCNPALVAYLCEGCNDERG